MITRERLCDLVLYEPDSGIFRWARTRKKCTKGATAGSRRQDGYILIRLDGLRYYGHRLAWLYMTGDWPSLEVDHKNGDPSDNRWRNLRVATPRQNMQNRPMQKNNTVGLKGVRRSGKKFYSMIRANRRDIYLGRFATAEAAHDEYVSAAQKHFGEFARAA